MKNLSVHILLALVGLASAYVVWTSDELADGDGDGIVVAECLPADVTRLTFINDRRRVILEPRGEGELRAWWVKVARNPDGEDHPHDVEFVTNDGIDEYLESIAPLRAVRSLGEVDEDVFAELGLDEESRATLEMACGDRDEAFHVGGTTFGGGDRYLRRANGGPVYLLTGEVVRGLENAEFQLMQRELHAFEMTEVAGLEVEIEGSRKALVHRDHANEQQAAWVAADDQDRINELYGNWLDRLGRLRVQSYLALDAEPGADLEGRTDAAPEPVLTLSWTGADGEEIGHLEMVKLPLTRPVYYARSEATRAWVRVVATTAQEVEDDARSVVGLPPIVRPVPEAPTPAEGAEGTEGTEGAAATEGADPGDGLSPEGRAGSAAATGRRPLVPGDLRPLAPAMPMAPVAPAPPAAPSPGPMGHPAPAPRPTSPDRAPPTREAPRAPGGGE
ncbi:MAG: DUF4340 domain-containing protein [Deltaproteobacteria bacterium]|nr:DUF4340 domain-containing protein [Deltaproteobacteria bacterium]